jgi:hypothetical protein
MANNDRSAMLQKLRDRLLKKKGGFRRDPGEWRAPQVGPKEKFKAKAYILPPVERGETCTSGEAEMGMDGLFFTQVGDHWIDRKKYPCPRVYDNDDCPYCQLGFNLLSETDDKQARSEISRAYLPRTQYVVNLFFPDVSSNPDDLRGQVKYYALPKTIFDKLEACIQNDDAGDDPDEPQAWGIFYDSQDAYPLSIKINRKGDFNSYTDTELLANAKGPIAESDEEIQKILDQRHDLPSKYPQRSSENLKSLEGFVDALMNGASDDDGFDSDETQESEPAPVKTKAKPKAKAKPEPEPVAETTPEPVAEDSTSETQVEDEELQALLDSIKKSD